MRIFHPQNLGLADPAARPLTLTAERGEQITLAVVADDIVRVCHHPDGAPRLDRTWMIAWPEDDVPREGRLRATVGGAPGAPSPGVPCDVRTAGDRLEIATSQLGLSLSLRDGSLSWRDAAGLPFAADLPGRAYSYDRGGATVYHYMVHRPGDHYYGFGERSGPLDKAGLRLRMLDLDALGYSARDTDPLYKHFPFYITLASDLGIAYGLLYDNLATTTFDMGREIDAYHGPYRTYEAAGGDVDYYMIYGPTIPEVVRKLARLVGCPALMPRWSLGYLGSTMAYTEAPDAQDQIERFVALCAEHRIPCDLFHLSSGYCLGADGKRYVFEWNRDRVPDPAGMVRTFHDAGIRLAANVKPCLLTTHPRYREVVDLGGFIRQAGAPQPEVAAFWGGDGSYVDFTSQAGYRWWQTRLQEALLAYGIDATWNDNNEYEIWDDAAQCEGFGDPLPIGLLRPVQSLLHARASREAQLAARPGERPYLISRSGCPGIQRYAQTWSGDNHTSWETLRYNIPMGLGLSLSGAPNTGHDVGGFAGLKPEPELFLRWVQNGIFHPRFCIHSWHSDGTVNEPWMYPELLPLVRAAIELRYRLIPYLYTLLFESARDGSPIIRPLVYSFPEDARCQTESFDFMLGPNLLVASVLEPGARSRTVYLPGSQPWCDFHTGAWHAPGQVVELPAPLERSPLLAPAGALIPLGKVMRYVGEQADDLRQVYVYPHPAAGEGRFTLVEDDGVSLAYRDGAFTEVRLAVQSTPAAIRLAVDVQGGYRLPYDSIEFVLPPGEERRVCLGANEHPAATRRWADGRTRVELRL